MSTLVYTVLAISGLYVFFDVSYFLRGAYMWLRWKGAITDESKGILEESVHHSICWTSDLDFMMHMNNSRYLRECDFARFKLWFDSGVFGTLRRINASMVVASSTVRYRRSMHLLERFQIRSRVLCWDDRAFYVEQRVERASDNFICAIVILKQFITGGKMDELLEALYGHHIPCPEFPEEVELFIECHRKSSETLRRDGNSIGRTSQVSSYSSSAVR